MLRHILTYTVGDLQTWFLFMVPVSGQPLARLDTVLKPKNQNFCILLNSVFLQPVQVQTDFNHDGQYTYNATLR
jgi:hypothetical protein